MKKLVLFAAAIVAISFASCTPKANTDAAPGQDTTVIAPEAPVTPAVVDSPAVDAPAVDAPAVAK